MKRLLFLSLAFMSVILNSCQKQEQEPVIGKKEMKLSDDRMTPEVLWAFGRVGDVAVSPDQKHVLFSIGYYDVALNKGNRDLYIMSLDGSNVRNLTLTKENEFNPLWRPDGKKIGYISSASGETQFWEMNPDGSGKKKISNIAGGITGFKYSPDMKKIAYTAGKKLPEPELDPLYKGLDKTTGKVINRMMFRHWDEWIETYSHLYLADYDGNQLTNVDDLLGNEPWDVPMKPFWGMEQVSWSPDSKKIAYASKKKDGKSYAISTNSDIYLYDIDLKQTTNFTLRMTGYDLSPAFSPDGTKLAWESMPRDGYESDKNRIIVYDLISNQQTDYTSYFDQDVHGIIWAENSKSIFFLCNWYGTDEIFKLDLDGKITELTKGVHDFTSIQPAGDQIIATMMSMSMPVEIFSVPAAGGKEKQISFVNKDLLEQLTMGKVEARWIETTDQKKMLAWVIYPPHFDPSRKYPALLFCEGGPQNTVSQFWSYRWNFQMMAANDYIVVAPNRRGVPGFGQAWKEQISGDYNGQNMQDYLSAIDAIAKEPFVDKECLGAVGASYGGFSVYWLAGHHDKRFRAFIAHDGIFNTESAYLETDEQWFPNWDMGGAPWDTDNQVAQKSYENSPHHFIKNWDAPILIVHSENDYRISVTQGMMAFNAAQLMNIPSQFLYFPDENHWVLKPQNGILWQRTFFNWLDTYLKPPPGVRK